MGKPYNAVMIVTVPLEWTPGKVFNIPPAFYNARYFATRLHINAAIEICRTHNADRLKAQAATGEPIGEWMFHLRELKTRPPGSWSRILPNMAPDPNSYRSKLKGFLAAHPDMTHGESMTFLTRAARAAEGGV